MAQTDIQKDRQVTYGHGDSMGKNPTTLDSVCAPFKIVLFLF